MVGSAPAANTPLFKTPQTFQAGLNPVAVMGGDFNGDSKADLAVANNSSGTSTCNCNLRFTSHRANFREAQRPLLVNEAGVTKRRE
jgi:hypothetical protein